MVEHIAHHGCAHGEQGGKEERQEEILPRVGIDGVQAGQRGIGDADGAVLEAGVDASFLDLADQLFVEAAVGIGLAFH